MAEEPIRYSGLTTDARASVAISAVFLSLFTGNDALPAHEAIVYAGEIEHVQASKTKRVPHYGLDGQDEMEEVAEGTAVESTDLALGHSDVTVARYTIARDIGDLARMTDPNAVIDPVRLGNDAYGSYVGTVVSLVADVVDGYTATKGTSGADLTFEVFLDALGELSNVHGRKMAILHTKQWNQLQKEMALEVGGAIQFLAATAEMIQKHGPGFQGSYGDCDIFTTDKVKDDGTDYKGAIIARGAVVWCDGRQPIDDPTQQLLIGGKVVWERDRDPRKATTDWVANAWLGVAKGIDARGVTLISAVPS